MELYVLIATISAILYGVSIALDKLFFTNIEGNTHTYNQQTISFIFAIIFILYGFLLIPFTPVNLTPAVNSLALMLGAGVLYGVAMLFYYHALQRESASKIGQLASLEAITTPIFAITFLGESPSPLALLAVSLIIIGLFLLIFDRGTARAISTAKIAVIPMILSVLLWSAQDTTIKYITNQENFFTLYFWMRLSAAILLSSLLLRPTVRTQIKQLAENRKKDNTHILILSGIVTSTALITTIYAISLGPLTLVAPIIAAYPIPTIILTVLFTKYTSYEVHGTETTYLFKRIISILLFLTGITLLTLT